MSNRESRPLKVVSFPQNTPKNSPKRCKTLQKAGHESRFCTTGSCCRQHPARIASLALQTPTASTRTAAPSGIDSKLRGSGCRQPRQGADPHDLRMSAVFSQCPKEMQYPLNVREWRPNSMQCCLINGRSVRTCGRINVQLFSNGNSPDERYSGSLRLTWNPRATATSNIKSESKR